MVVAVCITCLYLLFAQRNFNLVINESFASLGRYFNIYSSFSKSCQSLIWGVLDSVAVDVIIFCEQRVKFIHSDHLKGKGYKNK